MPFKKQNRNVAIIVIFATFFASSLKLESKSRNQTSRGLDLCENNFRPGPLKFELHTNCSVSK